jgi:hypothetical protein
MSPKTRVGRGGSRSPGAGTSLTTPLPPSPPLDELLPEQTLGRLIEVDDGALRVNQEYGRRELRGKAPRQYEGESAVPVYPFHASSLIRGSRTQRCR